MKRMLLFFFTNFLVSISLMIVAGIVMSMMGVQFGSYPGLFVFCFILGMGGAFVSLQLSRWMAKRTMGLQEVAPGSQLVHKVHSLARKAGLDEMPEVYIFHSPEINAFATGPSRNKSLVAVSSGLLERMNDDEAEAVLAHEVSHIANGDMVTMMLVQGIVNSFVMFFSYIVTQVIMNALNDDDDGGRSIGDFFLYHLIHNVVYTILGFMSLPLVMFVSRWREFRADYGSAELVGKHKMIAALQSLKSDVDNVEKHDKSIEVMAISSGRTMMEFFSSHPPLEKRILALQQAKGI